MQKIFYHKNSLIHYTDIGVGNIIFLIHGFGEDATIWNKQIHFLKDTYRVIVLNLPGAGGSQLLQNKNTTIDDYATCIYDLLLQLKTNTTQQVYMFGHSMGGYITLAFATLFPQKLAAFGLIHSTAFADSEEKKQARLRGIEMMQEYGSYAFLKNTIPNLFSSSFKQHNGSVVEVLIENGKQFSTQALQQYYTAIMNRGDATETLIKSTVPVLFIMGTDDVAAPINDVLQQCYLPQFSYIKILQNVGHIGMLEASDETNNAIDYFLTFL
jgi:pimeloyl-ACP methyl ester carboxylesterase